MIIRPRYQAPSPLPRGRGPGAAPGQAAKAAARRAAIKRAAETYIPLACGHYTDPETDLRHSVFRPAGKPLKHWCDRCGRWKPRTFRTVTTDPDEPLF